MISLLKIRRPAQRVLLVPILWVCFAEFAICASPLAPSRDRALSELHHSSWTVNNGIPGEVQALAQTSDGYLWLGTSNGLCRFDGATIERYEPPQGERFPGHIIESLLATPDDGLLIGFRNEGASYLREGKVTTYGATEGLPATTVRGFARTSDGAVWAATGAGLFRLVGTRWQKIGTEWNYLSLRAQTVFVDRADTLWVAGDDSVVYLGPGEKQFHQTAEHVTHTPDFEAIRQAPDGSIWVDEASYSVRPVALNKHETAPPHRPQIIVGAGGVLFDDAGSLWIASLGDGIGRIRVPEQLKAGSQKFRSVAEIFSQKDGLSSDYVYCVLEDREGNIWLGTSAGLDRFQETSFVPIVLPAGSDNMILIAGDHSDIFTGSLNRSFTHVEGTSVTEVVPTDRWGLTSGFRDSDGSFWLGSPQGLQHFVDGRFVTVPLPRGIKNPWVFAIAHDRSGALWASIHQSGVYRLSAGVWTEFGRAEGLPLGVPNSLYTDSEGRVWMGYSQDQLAEVDGNAVRTLSASDGIDVGEVATIYEHGAHLWIGGEFGLQLFEGGRFRKLSAADEADFRCISGIIETTNGDLWLNAANGILYLPASGVSHALADPNYRVQPTLFDHLDGLPGTSASLRVRPTAIQGTDGRIWFSVANGVVWINPAHLLKNSLPPPVYISSVTADNQEYLRPTDLSLPVRTSNLRIAYTALSLTTPERVRFRYKLDGVDRDWQDPGTRREASYTNLGPGVHRFRVLAANNDGVWNDAGATLKFTIAPAFYQTRWFLVGCIVAGGCLIWAVYLWRIRSLTARLDLRFNERLSERTRIAQELHDTLLQGVLSASIQLDLANEELEPQAPAKPLVERVLELMRQVVDDGRAALRGLRVFRQDMQSLDQAFSRIPEELGLQPSVEFRVIVEGTPRALRPVIRDELYRIGREAAANALRHSGAKKIELALDYGIRELRLSVRDDGSGIDAKVLQFGRDGHWGISGMRERAEKIGAQLKVWSSAANGTQVDLRVHGRIAFESPASSSVSKFMAKLYGRGKRDTDSQQGMRVG